MKIQERNNMLYIGQLWDGCTCRQRMLVLESLGFKIIGFDTTDYMRHPNRIVRSLSHRLNVGSPVKMLNDSLIKFVEQLQQPVDFIWIDKGKWIKPETLIVLKNKLKAFLIHYTPDPQLFANKSVFFQKSIPLYDILFTTKPFEVEKYRDLGAGLIKLVSQSYDGKKIRPKELESAQVSRYRADATFIGRYEKHYAHCLSPVAGAGIDLKIWGPGWRRRLRKYRIKNAFSGDGVWGEDYGTALNAACIGIGLLSKLIPETTTTRTFEIPGSGTFMLAERTEEHQALFKEGVEAEYFSDLEELRDKIRFYLKHREKREKIAAAGYQRCLKSGYDHETRMKQLVNMVFQEAA